MAPKRLSTAKWQKYFAYRTNILPSLCVTTKKNCFETIEPEGAQHVPARGTDAHNINFPRFSPCITGWRYVSTAKLDL